jgi:hypothetical protein
MSQDSAGLYLLLKNVKLQMKSFDCALEEDGEGDSCPVPGLQNMRVDLS